SDDQGDKKNLGDIGIHVANDRQNDCRRNVLEECERTYYHCGLRGEVGADGNILLPRLSCGYQYQSRRAEFVAYSHTGWGAFNVLCGRNGQGQPTFCQGYGSWSTSRDGALI